MTHPGGRPIKYNEEVLTKAREYLDTCKDELVPIIKMSGDKGDVFENRLKVKLPSIEGLALYLHIARATVYDWAKKYPEFSYIIEELLAKQAECLLNNGLSGDYNQTIAKVILTKHGYREGLDQTTNDKDLPVPILGGVTQNNV